MQQSTVQQSQRGVSSQAVRYPNSAAVQRNHRWDQSGSHHGLPSYSDFVLQPNSRAAPPYTAPALTTDHMQQHQKSLQQHLQQQMNHPVQISITPRSSANPSIQPNISAHQHNSLIVSANRDIDSRVAQIRQREEHRSRVIAQRARGNKPDDAIDKTHIRIIPGGIPGYTYVDKSSPTAIAAKIAQMAPNSANNGQQYSHPRNQTLPENLVPTPSSHQGGFNSSLTIEQINVYPSTKYSSKQPNHSKKNLDNSASGRELSIAPSVPNTHSSSKTVKAITKTPQMYSDSGGNALQYYHPGNQHISENIAQSPSILSNQASVTPSHLNELLNLVPSSKQPSHSQKSLDNSVGVRELTVVPSVANTQSSSMVAQSVIRSNNQDSRVGLTAASLQPSTYQQKNNENSTVKPNAEAFGTAPVGESRVGPSEVNQTLANESTSELKVSVGEWIDDIDLAIRVYVAHNLIEPFSVFEQRFLQSLKNKRRIPIRSCGDKLVVNPTWEKPEAPPKFAESRQLPKSGLSPNVIDLTNDPVIPLIKPKPISEMLDYSVMKLNRLVYEYDKPSLPKNVPAPLENHLEQVTGDTMTLYSEKGVCNVKTSAVGPNNIFTCHDLDKPGGKSCDKNHLPAQDAIKVVEPSPSKELTRFDVPSQCKKRIKKSTDRLVEKMKKLKKLNNNPLKRLKSKKNVVNEAKRRIIKSKYNGVVPPIKLKFRKNTSENTDKKTFDDPLSDVRVASALETEINSISQDISDLPNIETQSSNPTNYVIIHNASFDSSLVSNEVDLKNLRPDKEVLTSSNDNNTEVITQQAGLSKKNSLDQKKKPGSRRMYKHSSRYYRKKFKISPCHVVLEKITLKTLLEHNVVMDENLSLIFGKKCLESDFHKDKCGSSIREVDNTWYREEVNEIKYRDGATKEDIIGASIKDAIILPKDKISFLKTLAISSTFEDSSKTDTLSASKDDVSGSKHPLLEFKVTPQSKNVPTENTVNPLVREQSQSDFDSKQVFDGAVIVKTEKEDVSSTTKVIDTKQLVSAEDIKPKKHSSTKEDEKHVISSSVKDQEKQAKSHKLFGSVDLDATVKENSVLSPSDKKFHNGFQPLANDVLTVRNSASEKENKKKEDKVKILFVVKRPSANSPSDAHAKHVKKDHRSESTNGKKSPLAERPRKSNSETKSTSDSKLASHIGNNFNSNEAQSKSLKTKSVNIKEKKMEDKHNNNVKGDSRLEKKKRKHSDFEDDKSNIFKKISKSSKSEELWSEEWCFDKISSSGSLKRTSEDKKPVDSNISIDALKPILKVRESFPKKDSTGTGQNQDTTHKKENTESPKSCKNGNNLDDSILERTRENSEKIKSSNTAGLNNTAESNSVGVSSTSIPKPTTPPADRTNHCENSETERKGPVLGHITAARSLSTNHKISYRDLQASVKIADSDGSSNSKTLDLPEIQLEHLNGGNCKTAARPLPRTPERSDPRFMISTYRGLDTQLLKLTYDLTDTKAAHSVDSSRRRVSDCYSNQFSMTDIELKKPNFLEHVCYVCKQKFTLWKIWKLHICKSKTA